MYVFSAFCQEYWRDVSVCISACTVESLAFFVLLVSVSVSSFTLKTSNFRFTNTLAGDEYCSSAGSMHEGGVLASYVSSSLGVLVLLINDVVELCNGDAGLVCESLKRSKVHVSELKVDSNTSLSYSGPLLTPV